jgi:hypothetical protein
VLHFARFAEEVAAPVPAREVYERPGPGEGWPSQCPPIRAANAFGWDVLTTFPMTFRRDGTGGWRHEDPVDLESDWVWEPAEGDAPRAEEARPQVQRNAWFWEKGQTLPHPISDDVWERLRDQVKVSTWLYLATDANEVLLLTDVPGLRRPFRALTALVETDWYPASYPWHCVLELDPGREEIVIPAGEPLCRLVPLRRDTYLAREMVDAELDAFFQRGQDWLARHGKGEPGPMMDLRGQYARQQQRSRFLVLP